ncbi:armadillo-type protein [Mycena sp. CBHHK59/15]|nr:armadillo-type protein [Mycena sp. CBHHK59/15]
MPPLQHWSTHLSTQSWWSDSNRPGATISLHALAKLLMKFMYHQQVSEFLNQNRGSLLSKEKEEILSSYLGAYYETEARVIVDGNILPAIIALLHSTDPAVLLWTCSLLGEIAKHKSLNAVVVDLDLCPRLMSLLGEKDTNGKTCLGATMALGAISESEQGACAVLDANALVCAIELLDSGDSEILQRSCRIIRNVASHESLIDVVHVITLDSCMRLGRLSQWGTWGYSPDREVLQLSSSIIVNIASHASLNAAVIALDPWMRVVSLAEHKDFHVRSRAMDALESLSAESEDGSSAVVHVLGPVMERLESPDLNVVISVCSTIENIASHESLSAGVISLDPCTRLVSLLEHTDFFIGWHAKDALDCIAAGSEDGVRVIANALGPMMERLESPDRNVLISVCSIIEDIAFKKSLKAAIIALDPCARLVSLAQHADPGVRHQAITALVSISTESEDGARLVANVVDRVVEFLESQDALVLEQTCSIIENIASHTSLVHVIALDLCTRLVSLAKWKYRGQTAGGAPRRYWNPSVGSCWSPGSPGINWARRGENKEPNWEEMNPNEDSQQAVQPCMTAKKPFEGDNTKMYPSHRIVALKIQRDILTTTIAVSGENFHTSEDSFIGIKRRNGRNTLLVSILHTLLAKSPS